MKKLTLNVRYFLAFAYLFLLVCGSQASATVLVGIDTLRALGYPGLQGKRVGLVTNPSGVDSRGVSTISVLRSAKGVNLVALFGPEHGVYGTVKAGSAVGNQKDPKTGLPVYSLFGDTRKPTPQMLHGIDVLIYDLQDIGVRSYTYISTLGLVMQAAAEQGVEVYVLDRPNPLGGMRIEGNGVDPRYSSFVGQYNIPYVYGLTSGELALWINARWLEKPCKLRVFRMEGWTREMAWRDTGLKWVATSPNIPSAEAAVGYAATGLLGDLGISNGANVTAYPFQIVAEENLDSSAVTRRFNSYGLSGVMADPFSFYPTSGKYTQVRYNGIKLEMNPHAKTSLLAINFRILDVLRTLNPSKNYFSKASADGITMFDKINGGPANRRAWNSGKTTESIVSGWRDKEASWVQERKPYLLY